jgi:hypothetical protein
VNYDLYLSYSGRKAYTICPKKYEYTYVQKLKVPIDPKNSLFGSAIGKLFEWFYNDSLWAQNNVLQSTLDRVDLAISNVCRHNKFDPESDPHFIKDLRADLIEFSTRWINVIRKHHLLFVESNAEVDLSIVYFNSKHNLTLKLGGKADLILRDNDEIWLMDGKASKYRDKYTDVNQLIWYATQFYLKYHIAPTRLGFLYWRFPENPIQWIHYDAQSLRNCVDETFEIAKNILNKCFPIRVSSACRFCDHKIHCSDGMEYLSVHQLEKSKKIESSIFDLDPV